MASIPVLLVQYFAKMFYSNHPEFISHGMRKLEFEWDVFFEAFNNLDQYFRNLMPAFWVGNWVVLLVILFFGIVLWKKSHVKSISIVTGVIFIVLLIGVNKVNEDLNTLFLSSVRMFLAVPFVLALAIFWNSDMFLAKQKFWKNLLFIVGLVVFTFKIFTIDSVVQQQTKKVNYNAVANKSLVNLTKECSEINELSIQYNVDLVVFVPNWNLNIADLTFYDYGCPVLIDDFKPTVLNIYEKRTWSFEMEKRKIRETIMIYGFFPNKVDSLSQIIDCKLIQKEPNIILISNNNRTLPEIANMFDFVYKRHPY